MKRVWIKSRFIILFFLALTSLTAFSYVRLGDESVDQNQSLYALLQQRANSKSPQLRRPASERSQRSSGSDSLSIQHELFCSSTGHSPSQSKVRGNMIMLNFKLCKNLRHVAQLAIQNESNGFRAQSFQVATNNFKTDFIQLSPGNNRLRLEVVLKDGQKLTEALDILSGS